MNSNGLFRWKAIIRHQRLPDSITHADGCGVKGCRNSNTYEVSRPLQSTRDITHRPAFDPSRHWRRWEVGNRKAPWNSSEPSSDGCVPRKGPEATANKHYSVRANIPQHLKPTPKRLRSSATLDTQTGRFLGA